MSHLNIDNNEIRDLGAGSFPENLYLKVRYTRLDHVGDMGVSSITGTGGNELPDTHSSLCFSVSLTIFYCRINKLSTDNSSETLTQGL